MKYSKIIIKQTDVYMHGHIYEHIITNEINKWLMTRCLFPIIDFHINARIDDGIIIIPIETNCIELIDEIIYHIDRYKFNQTIVNNTIEQISAEYGCPYKAELEKLTNKLQQIHEQPWLDRHDNLDFTKPITDEARIINAKEIQYSRRSPRSFNEISYVYKLHKCPYELKPLTVYIVQLLAIAHINLLYRKIKYCYDFGDEWAKYQDLVGYIHNLRIHKKYNKTDDEYLELFYETKEFLLDNDFITRTINFVRQQAELDFAYFSIQDMFAYSYAIPGRKGLIKTATKKNIEYILNNLVVTIGHNQ